jgi:PBSX family phage terminase large subunit
MAGKAKGVKAKNYDINWPKWEEIINKAFIPLITDDARFKVLFGGRGSGKSDAVSKILIYRCLTEAHFSCVGIRTTYSDIKETQYKVIKENIDKLHLGELFECVENPLRIKCINGNGFIFRGMDEPLKLKSLVDISCLWWEECPDSTITEDDWITVSSSVRTIKTKKVDEWFTVNSEIKHMHFQDFWFWKRFFGLNPNETSFKNFQIVKVEDREVKLTWTVLKSTYIDNRWVSDGYKAWLLDFKRTKPYYYDCYALGNWGNQENDQGFYKMFNRGKHCYTDIVYDPDKALHLSVDFNVNPYCSATIWQLDGNIATCIDEIATKHPNNNTKGVCMEFLKKYKGHSSGLFIYGDSTGKKKDTRNEADVNDFTIIYGFLREFNPILRVPTKNPSVVARGNWINEIFAGDSEISIKISDKCIHLINDLLFGKEAADGTKNKEKRTIDGVSFEVYHHHDDGMDYILCEAYKTMFNKKNSGGMLFVPVQGKEPFNEKFRY